MPRKLSPQNQIELERLGHELRVIAHELFPDDRFGVLAVLDEAVRDRNLRGLRMVQGDYLEMMAGASPAQRAAIDARLREVGGRPLAEIDSRARVRLERIVSRGVLRGEEQYYFVRGQLELLLAEPGADKLAARVQSLLAAFEERVAARAGKRQIGPSAR